MNVSVYINSPSFSEIHDFFRVYDFLINYLYLLDLLIVSVGYLLTFRVLDSHMRSVEPSFLGWIVAISCYQPFWGALSGHYFSYDNGFFWGHMIGANPAGYTLWGSFIILLTGIYVWASIPFGIRFSNLTHRGILTNGPYRWSKHPAYISKNISWWMISVPFFANASVLEAVQQCTLLSLVNLIYFTRARTEERHLSRDPIYRDYAEMINRKGFLSFIGRIIPALSYNSKHYNNLAQTDPEYLNYKA